MNHIVQISFRIYFLRKHPANPQSLTKHNGTFGMVWMSRSIVQVLMFVCRLNVQVCSQLTSRQAHLKVQKGNVFFIELMGKFNVRVVVIKIFQFFFTMCLNEENIIDISKPYQRLKLLCIKEISFYFIHKNGSMCRSKFCTNGSHLYLVFNFSIKFKVVVFKNKCCHFD